MCIKLKKDEKGITLIALVITVIILLILAGVSIATFRGQNGIISQSETARVTAQIQEIQEIVKIELSKLEVQDKKINAEERNEYILSIIESKNLNNGLEVTIDSSLPDELNIEATIVIDSTTNETTTIKNIISLITGEILLNDRHNN